MNRSAGPNKGKENKATTNALWLIKESVSSGGFEEIGRSISKPAMDSIVP